MRFHFGVSFSWYKIKKFLIPFLLGVLAFLGFDNFTFVNAATISTNLDTSFEFQYDFTYDLSSYPFGDSVPRSFRQLYPTFGDLYDYIYSNVSPDSRYQPIFFFRCDKFSYDVCLTDVNTHFEVYIVDKQDTLFLNNNNSFNINFLGVNYESYDVSLYSQIFTSYYYYFDFPLNYSLGHETQLRYLISVLNDDFNYLELSDYRRSDYIRINYGGGYSSTPLSNDSSHGFSKLHSYLYDSFVDLTLTYTNTLSLGTEVFIKQVAYGLLYPIQIYPDSLFPTFLDVKNGSFNTSPNSNYGKDLGSFYFGGLAYSTLQHFSFSYSFDTYLDSASTYFNNSSFIVKYFGRKYDSTNHFYSYDELSCSRGSLSATSLTLKRVNLSYTVGSCSGDLSIYDSFMITFTPYLVKPGLDTSFSNLFVNSPTYFFRGNLADSDFFDIFYLNRDFKILVSSNSSVTLTALSDSRFFSASYYDISSSSFKPNYDFTAYSSDSFFHSYTLPNNETFNNFYGFQSSISSQSKKGLYIYGLPDLNSYSGFTLYLFSNVSTIVSENTNGVFSYYDSSGTITQSSIYIPELNYSEVSSTNGYSVSSWVDLINSFISDFNDDFLSLHLLVDNAFYSLNPFIQNLLIILTILFCLKYLFNLIHK